MSGGRPRLLDAFCGQGGAAQGYADAGFEVVGVDVVDQPRYPFEFHQGDALEFIAEHGREFDVIHASPPCQDYLNLTKVNAAMGRTSGHRRLITETRTALVATRRPFVIENVEDARRELIDPVRICGTGLGRPLRRHRMFESNFPLEGVPCDHGAFNIPRYWTSWRPRGEHRLSTVVQVYGNAGGREEWPAALGVDWMDAAGMVECVPPAYTEHIGAQLLAALDTRMTTASHHGSGTSERSRK